MKIEITINPDKSDKDTVRHILDNLGRRMEVVSLCREGLEKDPPNEQYRLFDKSDNHVGIAQIYR